MDNGEDIVDEIEAAVDIVDCLLQVWNGSIALNYHVFVSALYLFINDGHYRMPDNLSVLRLQLGLPTCKNKGELCPHLQLAIPG